MEQRPAAFEDLIEKAKAAYQEHATDARSRESVSRIFRAIENSRGKLNPANPKLPVCDYLPEAASSATRRKSLQDLVDAFVAFEPHLGWRRRPTCDAKTASDNFLDGHGNCMIIGPGGYEDRSNLGLGVSLLAPDVRYPDHDHPAEETYLVVPPRRRQLVRAGSRRFVLQRTHDQACDAVG